MGHPAAPRVGTAPTLGHLSHLIPDLATRVGLRVPGTSGVNGASYCNEAHSVRIGG